MTTGVVRVGDTVRRPAGARVQPWLSLWETGHGTSWQADADYIEARAAVWTEALLG